MLHAAVTAIAVATLLLGAVGLVDRFTMDMILLVCAAWGVARMLAASLPTGTAVSAAALGLGLLISVRVTHTNLQFMPYLAIVPANLWLAFTFGRGLFGGRKPVLLSIIQRMGQKPADDPRFLRFIAGQCALWSLLTAVTAMLAFACIFWGTIHPMLPSVLGTIAVAQVAWFALSHYYARVVHNRPETWMMTLQTMMRPNTWREMAA